MFYKLHSVYKLSKRAKINIYKYEYLIKAIIKKKNCTTQQIDDYFMEIKKLKNSSQQIMTK